MIKYERARQCDAVADGVGSALQLWWRAADGDSRALRRFRRYVAAPPFRALWTHFVANPIDAAADSQTPPADLFRFKG